MQSVLGTVGYPANFLAVEELTMLCQNCGRQVEFIGNVCPWCGVQKIQSQSIHMFIYIYGIPLGLLGGFIGNKVNDEYGMIVGALIGLVVGVALGYRTGSTAGIVNLKCPHCRTDLEVTRSEGPNYKCPKCGQLFHLR